MALIQRRACTVPTWRGWLLLGATGLAAIAAMTMALYPFLALRDDGSSAIWAVEGWMADSALRQLAADPDLRDATAIFVIGGALDKGSVLLDHQTHARAGALTLVKLGLDPRRVYVVTSPEVPRDRTLTMMLALRACLQRHASSGGDLMLASPGPHARRSRMVLSRVLADSWTVRVRAIEASNYEADEWWQTSQGFRDVIGELIAYLHAVILVHPPRTAPDSGSGGDNTSVCAAVSS
jgi:hypothetical protein